tara:strand:+ start:140716 stop:141006 length:291 start_codon:yes stop_codon:yes gene_type:complete
MRKLACKECLTLIEVRFSDYFSNRDIECQNCKTNHIIDYNSKKNTLILMVGLLVSGLIGYFTSYDSILIDITFWIVIIVLCFKNISLEKVNWNKIK